MPQWEKSIAGERIHPSILEAPVEQRAPARTSCRACPGHGHAPGWRGRCTASYCIEARHGLLLHWWAPSSFLTAPTILSSLEAYRALSDGYALPVVIHLQEPRGISPAGRAAMLEATQNSRVALVGNGPVDRVLTAFSEGGLSDTRYFESVVHAELWARGAGVLS
ncbi:hypothetical protein AC792_14930 [Arthrobacter sp. RIT-PI-e]|nr:hypothetical protein AC792_14930 [Arthrobacter sp. RIT-PI-e]